MFMLIGVGVVIVGVVIGLFTVAGSGIHNRPSRRERYDGESPLDSAWTMSDWSRGTQSRARRR
jgi:hypothetical protein